METFEALSALRAIGGDLKLFLISFPVHIFNGSIARPDLESIIGAEPAVAVTVRTERGGRTKAAAYQ